MATLNLAIPANNEQINLPITEDTTVFDLGFDLAEALIERIDDNLVISFDGNGSVITLEDFYAVYSAEFVPDFMMDGELVLGEDFFAALDPTLMPAAGPAATAATGGGSFFIAADALLATGVTGSEGLTGGSEYGRNSFLPEAEATNQAPIILGINVFADEYEDGTFEADEFNTSLDIFESGEGRNFDSTISSQSPNQSYAGDLFAKGEIVANDPEGGTLSFSIQGSGVGTYGTMTIDPVTGEFTYTFDDLDSLNEGETAQETFTFIVTDNQGAETTITVPVFITGTNDRPTLTLDANQFSATEDDPAFDVNNNNAIDGNEAIVVKGQAQGFDLDDEDVGYEDTTQAGTLNYFVSSTATFDLFDNDAVGGTDDANDLPLVVNPNGQADANSVGTTVLGQYGTLVINPATGEFTYTLDNNKAQELGVLDSAGTPQTFDEEFTIYVQDSNGAWRAEQITITVNGTNDAPVITFNAEDSSVVEEGVKEVGNQTPNTPFAGDLTASGSFSFSDVDLIDTLTFSLTDGSLQQNNMIFGAGNIENDFGTLVLTQNPDNSFSYVFTLDNTKDATQKLNEDQTKDITYTLEVSDGKGGFDTHTFTVTITGTNDKPELELKEATLKVTEDGALFDPSMETDSGKAIGTDVDIDTDNTDGNKGEILTYSIEYARPELTLVQEIAKGLKALGISFDQALLDRIENMTEAVYETYAPNTGSATELNGLYGKLVIDADSGEYTYTLYTQTEAEALGDIYELAYWALKYRDDNEDALKENFTVTVKDDLGAWNSEPLTVEVFGSNDRPVIEFAKDLNVQEAGVGIMIAKEFLPNAPDLGKQAAFGQMIAIDDINDMLNNLEFEVEGGIADAGSLQLKDLTGLELTALANVDVFEYDTTLTNDYGTLYLNSAKGSYIFVLDNDSPYTQALNEGEPKEFTFKFTVNDGQLTSEVKEVTLNIQGTNDKPELTLSQNEFTIDENNGDVANSVSGTVASLIDVDKAGDLDDTHEFSVGLTRPELGNEALQTIVESLLNAVGLPAGNALDSVRGVIEELFQTLTSQPEGSLLENIPGIKYGDKETVGDIDIIYGLYGKMTVNTVTGAYEYTLYTWDEAKGSVDTLAAYVALQLRDDGDDALPTENFTIYVKDENDAWDSQNVTITVNGISDVPVIEFENVDAEVTEAGVGNSLEGVFVTNALSAIFDDPSVSALFDMLETITDNEVVKTLLESLGMDTSNLDLEGNLKEQFLANLNLSKENYLPNAENLGDPTASGTIKVSDDDDYIFGTNARLSLDGAAPQFSIADFAVKLTANIAESVASGELGLSADAIQSITKVLSSFSNLQGLLDGSVTVEEIRDFLQNAPDLQDISALFTAGFDFTLITESIKESITYTLEGVYGDLELTYKGDGEYSYVYKLDNTDSDTQALDRGDKATENFDITAFDIFGNETSSTITVNVTGQNDRPILTLSPEVFIFTENATNNYTAEGQASSTDFDASATATYYVGPAGGVTIDEFVKALQAAMEGTNSQDTSAAIEGAFSAWLTVNQGLYDTAKSAADLLGVTSDQEAALKQAYDNTSNWKPLEKAAAFTKWQAAAALGNAEDNLEAAQNAYDDIQNGLIPLDNLKELLDSNDDGILDDAFLGSDAFPDLPLPDAITGSTIIERNGVKYDVQEGTYGTLEINMSTGEYTYTLKSEYYDDVEALNSNQSLTESFTIYVLDDKGAWDAKTIEVKINGSNEAPEIVEVTDAQVSEAYLLDGTKSDDDPNFPNQTKDISGTIKFSDSDANDTHAFAWDIAQAPTLYTSEGAEVQWKFGGVNADDATILIGYVGTTEVIVLTTTNNDGNNQFEYTVELKQSLRHDDPDEKGADHNTDFGTDGDIDEDLLSDLNFKFTITDSGNESVNGSINVNIQDDVVDVTNSNFNSNDELIDSNFGLTFGTDPGLTSSEWTYKDPTDNNLSFTITAGKIYGTGADGSTYGDFDPTNPGTLAWTEKTAGENSVPGLYIESTDDPTKLDRVDYDYNDGNGYSEALQVTIGNGLTAAGVTLDLGTLFGGKDAGGFDDEAAYVRFYNIDENGDRVLVYERLIEGFTGTGKFNLIVPNAFTSFELYAVDNGSTGDNSDFTLNGIELLTVDNITTFAGNASASGADGPFIFEIVEGTATEGFVKNVAKSTSDVTFYTDQYGNELAIDIDTGAWTLVKKDGTDGIDVEFNIKATDKDGDADIAPVLIEAADLTVVANTDVEVDEANLPDGTETDADELIQTGTVTVEGSAPASIEISGITFTGPDWTGSASVANGIVTITSVVNGVISYKYVLDEAYKNANAADIDVDLSFNMVITGVNGVTDDVDIEVNIDDDAPEAAGSNLFDHDSDTSTPDASMASVANGRASADLDVDFGADINGATISVPYSGATLPMVAVYNATTGLWGEQNNPSGSPFVHDTVNNTLKMGDVTFQLSADGKSVESVSFAMESVDKTVELTFTDGDGDTVSHTVHAENQINPGELFTGLEKVTISTNIPVPLNVGIAIDTSGSMSESDLNKVEEALKSLGENLDGLDADVINLCIVDYNSGARVILTLNATELKDVDFSKALDNLAWGRGDDMTNTDAGLTALEGWFNTLPRDADDPSVPNGFNFSILLSDGYPEGGNMAETMGLDAVTAFGKTYMLVKYEEVKNDWDQANDDRYTYMASDGSIITKYVDNTNLIDWSGSTKWYNNGTTEMNKPANVADVNVDVSGKDFTGGQTWTEDGYTFKLVQGNTNELPEIYVYNPITKQWYDSNIRVGDTSLSDKTAAKNAATSLKEAMGADGTLYGIGIGMTDSGKEFMNEITDTLYTTTKEEDLKGIFGTVFKDIETSTDDVQLQGAIIDAADAVEGVDITGTDLVDRTESFVNEMLNLANEGKIDVLQKVETAIEAEVVKLTDVKDPTTDSSITATDNDDVIIGFRGVETIDAGKGDDIVFGGAGDDFIFGNEGNDILFGGSGNDTIQGGKGDDVMTGGEDVDTFVWKSDDFEGLLGNDLKEDTITDFELGVDKLDLAALKTDEFTFTVNQSTTDANDVEIHILDKSGSEKGIITLSDVNFDADDIADLAADLNNSGTFNI